VNWVEPEILLDRSQNTVMVVSREDSFRFDISLRLVKRNDHERALQLFVFRNPCRIVEVKPCSEEQVCSLNVPVSPVRFSEVAIP